MATHALDLLGFPEYLECIKHVIRPGKECLAESDRNGNWTPKARDPLLSRALGRMVTKEKILVPVGGPGSNYKLLSTFEKLDTFFWFGSQWSSISTPNLTIFLDNNVASISHAELIRLLKHKVPPQNLPIFNPFSERTLRASLRVGTKRRRSSSDASESSHTSDLSSLIHVPTPSPPSTMRSTVSPIRKVRKSASASTPLQLQASGLLALSLQEQLEQRLSEMPWIRKGFEQFREKYPNDEFELVMDEGALKMKCHDCPKNLIKAEYPFSRGLSNVEAHFKNMAHRNAVKNRIHAKKPPRSSSQSVPTASMLSSQHISSSIPVLDEAEILRPSPDNPTSPSPNPTPTATSHTPATLNLSPVATNPIPSRSSSQSVPTTGMKGKEEIHLLSQHMSSPSPVVANPTMSPSTLDPTPAATNPTPTHLNPPPTAADLTPALTPPATNPVPAVPNPTLAFANPANPAPAMPEPSKSHFPVIPGAEPNSSAKLGAVRNGETAETRHKRKRPRTQLDDHEKQLLKDLEEDRNYIGHALLDTESKLIVQRESINVLEENAKIQKSLMQELKAELFSTVTKQQESIAFLEERAKIQTSLIEELKEELSSKVTQEQEGIVTLKGTMGTQADLIQELKRNLLLKEELSLKVTKQQERIEILEESSRSRMSEIQGLKEELLSARKRGEANLKRTTNELESRVSAQEECLESLKETATTQKSLIEEVRQEFSLFIANEKDSRQSGDLSLKGTSDALESRYNAQHECIESFKETANTQMSLIHELIEEVSMTLKGEQDSRRSANASLKGTTDALESRVSAQHECVESLKTTATQQKALIQEVKKGYLEAGKRVNEYQKKIDAQVEALVEASNSEKKVLQGLKEDVLLAMKRGEEYRQENDHRARALVEAPHVDESCLQELKEEISSALKGVEEVRKQIDARVGVLAPRGGVDARQRAEAKQKVRDLRERILQARKRTEELQAKKNKRLEALMRPTGKEKEDRAALEAEIMALTEHEQKERAYVSDLETLLLELFCEVEDSGTVV